MSTHPATSARRRLVPPRLDRRHWVTPAVLVLVLLEAGLIPPQSGRSPGPIVFFFSSFQTKTQKVFHDLTVEYGGGAELERTSIDSQHQHSNYSACGGEELTASCCGCARVG